MFYDPCFPGPPQKRPPQLSPPPCAKFGDFWDPPPDPPFFEVLAPDPLGHDPWPPTLRCSLIVRFDLWYDYLR